MKSSAVKQPILTKSELNKIQKYQKRIKSGGYSGWVTVRQSRTHGQGQILTSHKTDNPVHLLSLGEYDAFLKLEHDPTVIRIFTQFPLCIVSTMEIAERLNIVHPGAYKERLKHDRKVPAKTMTTDLVVSKRSNDGSAIIEPYSFKRKTAFDPAQKAAGSISRTIAKLKIETEYWSDRSAGLKLLDESFYSITESYNFLYLRECFDYPDYIDTASPLYLSALLTFTKILSEEAQLTLKQCIELVSVEIGIEPFHAECVFKHTVYQGLLPVDLSQKIDLWLPVPVEAKENPYAY